MLSFPNTYQVASPSTVLEIHGVCRRLRSKGGVDPALQANDWPDADSFLRTAATEFRIVPDRR